jgi:hypothetical protein
MQRRLTTSRIGNGGIRTFEDHRVGREPVSSRPDDISVLAPFLDRASADESVTFRTFQELKLLAAIMAHPSYSAGRKMETTREGANHVERIPG